MDAAALGIHQRTNLLQLQHKLAQERFELKVLREFSWYPSVYSVAAPIDLMLQTRFAPTPRRLRLLAQRIEGVPAYYEAAQASIERPTREHTELAIEQAPGNLSLLDDAGRLARLSKALGLRGYNHRILQIHNIHEAIPGHYTQLVHANRSPSLIKTAFGNGAMIEGWAVFSERMMLENGWGDQAPEMWLMWCKRNLRSVTNAILDYAAHVQGMGESEAMHLLTRQAFQTEQEARENWHRVTLTSVQLASCFSGYSEIMALREARRAQLGQAFSVKAFNEEFLSYGNAPVQTIRSLMLDAFSTP